MNSSKVRYSLIADKYNNSVAVVVSDEGVTLEVVCNNADIDEEDDVIWLHLERDDLLKLASMLTEAAKMVDHDERD